MPARDNSSRKWVLLTGATGLLGSALLAELLQQGRHVLCLVRAESPFKARQRVESALIPWGVCADDFSASGRLAAIRGDTQYPTLGINSAGIRRLGEMVQSVVHAAGSTAFSSQSDPDLFRTNVNGTRHLFDLAARCNVMDWHLVSTAYVGGRVADAIGGPTDMPRDFRNDYERSKWMAELIVRDASMSCGASLTTYRPSVIVGHSETGMITRYSGIYRVFRAVSLLARVASQDAMISRRRIPLEIRGCASSRPNLAFIDDVARELAEIFALPDARGGIFYLTHPQPPTNAEIQRALEEYYDIRGGYFQDPVTSRAKASRSSYEELFHGAVHDTAPYLVDAPKFDRTRTGRFVSRPPACWNHHRLLRLIDVAEKSGWRRPVNAVSDVNLDAAAIADYFSNYLPAAHRQFHLSQFSTMNLIVRYVVGQSNLGDWTCQFRHGSLVDVSRTNGKAASITYYIPVQTFWKIAAGLVIPTDAFLSNQIDIEGDIECAMKFAAIQREFVRQFPYAGPEK